MAFIASGQNTPEIAPPRALNGRWNLSTACASDFKLSVADDELQCSPQGPGVVPGEDSPFRHRIDSSQVSAVQNRPRGVNRLHMHAKRQCLAVDSS